MSRLNLTELLVLVFSDAKPTELECDIGCLGCDYCRVPVGTDTCEPQRMHPALDQALAVVENLRAQLRASERKVRDRDERIADLLRRGAGATVTTSPACPRCQQTYTRHSGCGCSR